jgi:hypothetical protein
MKKATSLVFALLLAISMLTFTSCTRISPTEAGFKISNSGDYRGIDSLPLLTGWQFYMPGASQIITIPTTMQHVIWSASKTEGEGSDNGDAADESIKVACYGGSGFSMDIGFNYHVNANKASKIYLSYKMSDLDKITATYLRNIVRKSMQDVSSTIPIDSILNNQSGYEDKVTKILAAKLSSQGFVLDNFSIISQPTPTDPDLARAIKAKITAKQDAERVVTELQSTIAENNKKISNAKADSSVVVIAAAGKAEAINKLQQHLTPEYIEYCRIEKWDGAYPTTMLGGANPMINVPIGKNR